jgi:hypothetical protein
MELTDFELTKKLRSCQLDVSERSAAVDLSHVIALSIVDPDSGWFQLCCLYAALSSRFPVRIHSAFDPNA